MVLHRSTTPRLIVGDLGVASTKVPSDSGEQPFFLIKHDASARTRGSETIIKVCCASQATVLVLR